MVLLRWSSLTLSQHQGPLSQQHDHPKPLRYASRLLAHSDLCSPSARMGKRKGCLLLVAQWKYQKWKLQAPGYSGQAGRSHLPPWELLLAAFHHVSEIRLPKPAAKAAKAASGTRRQPKWNTRKVSGWSLEESSAFIHTKWCAASSFLCTNTCSAGYLCGSFIILLERYKLRSQGNIKQNLLNKGGFNLLYRY